MAEADLSGKAHQQIEPDHRDRVDINQRGDAQVEAAWHSQRQQSDHDRNCRDQRIGIAEEDASHHTRSMLALPNSPSASRTAREKHDDGDRVLVLRRHVAGAERLEQPEQQAADHGADRAAHAAEHGGGKTLQRQQRADIVAGQRDRRDEDAADRADGRRQREGQVRRCARC